MDANEWRIHDALSVKFSKILYAWQHPETLSEPAKDEGVKQELVRYYFHNDPFAYHVLRALVHAAVTTASEILSCAECEAERVKAFGASSHESCKDSPTCKVFKAIWNCK